MVRKTEIPTPASTSKSCPLALTHGYMKEWHVIIILLKGKGQDIILELDTAAIFQEKVVNIIEECLNQSVRVM